MVPVEPHNVNLFSQIRNFWRHCPSLSCCNIKGCWSFLLQSQGLVCWCWMEWEHRFLFSRSEHKDGADYDQLLHSSARLILYDADHHEYQHHFTSLHSNWVFYTLETQCIKFIVQKHVNSANTFYSTLLSAFFCSSFYSDLFGNTSKKLVVQNRGMYFCFQ